MADERRGDHGTIDTLSVTIVTPIGPVTEEREAGAVTAPGRMGEFEVLPGHVPFLAQLHPGVLVLGDKQDQQVFAVSTGFLEVDPEGGVQVLVEQAVPADKVDLETARAAVDELRPQLRDWKGDTGAEFINLKARHDWAQAQLDAHARIA